MCADAHDQFVRSWPNRVAHVKNCPRETRQVVTNLDSVQPYCCAELCFVDSKSRDTGDCRQVKSSTVPEPVALLPGHASVRNERILRKPSISHSILNHHPAVELVYLGECR